MVVKNLGEKNTVKLSISRGRRKSMFGGEKTEVSEHLYFTEGWSTSPMRKG